MLKIYKLREWLTVPEAAKRLSISLGEEVNEADLLRLGLDGRLRLSVYFVNHAKARCGKVVGYEDAEWGEFSADAAAAFPNLPDEAKGKPLPYMRSLNVDGERFLTLSDNVTTLRGVWDLPMIGNEQLDIEHEYQNLTGGPAVTLHSIEGAFVEGPDGQVCQLQENFDKSEYQDGSNAQLERLKQHIAENGIEGAEAASLFNCHKEQRKAFLEKQRARPAEQNYYPAGGLPEDGVIVVRAEALREFEESLDDTRKAKDKPLAPRAETTYQNIIGPSFAKLQVALEAFDPKNPPRSKKAFMGVLESKGCDTREQEVFANIAAEHHGHSWRA